MNIQGLHSLPKLMATENLGSKILEQKSFIFEIFQREVVLTMKT